MRLVKKVSLSLYLVNSFFKNILRRNNTLKCNIHFTSTVVCGDKCNYFNDLITLSSFALSGHCYFQAINGIQLGKNCLFAPGVKLISSNHSVKNVHESVKTRPIIIGDDSWLGTNVIVLPGVHLGKGCIVGAGSVVTKSFVEENIIIAGNPAKIIRQYER